MAIIWEFGVIHVSILPKAFFYRLFLFTEYPETRGTFTSVLWATGSERPEVFVSLSANKLSTG